MSIYPVDFKNDKFWKNYMSKAQKEFIESYCECNVCHRKMSESTQLWAYHTTPYGAGSDYWCSEECMNGSN